MLQEGLTVMVRTFVIAGLVTAASLTTYLPANAAPPACPVGSTAVGVACQEDNYSRLVLIRACLDLQLGRLAGVQTGETLVPRDDVVTVQLVCRRYSSVTSAMTS